MKLINMCNIFSLLLLNNKKQCQGKFLSGSLSCSRFYIFVFSSCCSFFATCQIFIILWFLMPKIFLCHLFGAKSCRQKTKPVIPKKYCDIFLILANFWNHISLDNFLSMKYWYFTLTTKNYIFHDNPSRIRNDQMKWNDWKFSVKLVVRNFRFWQAFLRLTKSITYNLEKKNKNCKTK